MGSDVEDLDTWAHRGSLFVACACLNVRLCVAYLFSVVL